MGKFHKFLTELSAYNMIIVGYYRFTFSFEWGEGVGVPSIARKSSFDFMYILAETNLCTQS